MKTIDDIIRAAAAAGAARLAVAAAQESSVIEAAFAAFAEGIAIPILVGDPKAIAAAAAGANQGRGLDISAFELLPAKDVHQAASIAVGLVRDGKADFIMKGIIDTAPLLKTALNKETGINAGRLASHVAVIQVPTYHKLFVLSDAGLNIAPDLSGFVDIINSAVSVSKVLGVATPKVALLAAVEKVYPDKMPCTATAALLSQMNRRGQIKGCIVDGPFGLDNAISAESARIKGIVSDVAGDADVLIVPDIEAGNILYKCLLDLAQAKGAGIVMGAAKPVVLPSRADTAETKLASIALAALAGRRLG
ncbi:MAG: bifunctional enoyl-CoA hydratase/phosphate acetyltransferase [Spirochaetia bacterium]|jgi:phosphate butyryltransferase|uniref:Phosphate butyryltransferase n=2 Tax=root TaxID=1 RepID=A0A652ZZ61_9SPIR|nr:bifunctional enoyl-CoA hydratase/phosphate acetyltransferase [Spirochaetia bacterium]NLX45204.1 bifunctional enoyl-CoA hydratase/phosphate acetyltransferase [Treponema sp.]VBB41043.1 Phosphate butyryltransferase [uncultured Spirochaetota bacterium]HOI22102.1 bifunctional enoyl-CoA hydratase/phosphate acetyltransferase [Spirochaetales bacterium]